MLAKAEQSPWRVPHHLPPYADIGHQLLCQLEQRPVVHTRLLANERPVRAPHTGIRAKGQEQCAYVGTCLLIEMIVGGKFLATAPAESGPWSVVSVWGQRLVAAAAVVACVLLVVDAVFAI